MKSIYSLAFLALAACQMAAEPGPAPLPMPPEDACGAKALAYLVSRPESVLASMTLPAPTRIIHPREAVTMDYSAERLNILIDDKGLIAKINCG